MLAVLSGPDADALAAIVAAIPGVVAAVNSVLAKREARATNHAVNKRPEGDPTLYEIVSRLDLKVDRHLDWHRNASETGRRAAGDPGGDS